MIPTYIAQAAMLNAFDQMSKTFENLQQNLLARMEEIEQRKRGTGTPSELGSVGSRTPSLAPIEPEGFASFFSKLTKGFARKVIINDPAVLTLMVDDDYDVVAKFYTYAVAESNTAEMIAHMRRMCQPKVRNTQLDRVHFIVPQALMHHFFRLRHTASECRNSRMPHHPHRPARDCKGPHTAQIR
jgi:hypothetical protein